VHLLSILSQGAHKDTKAVSFSFETSSVLSSPLAILRSPFPFQLSSYMNQLRAVVDLRSTGGIVKEDYEGYWSNNEPEKGVENRLP